MNTPKEDFEWYGAQGYVKVVFHEENEGYLVIHPDHGQNEWEQNKEIGRYLAERGEAIVLLPNQPDRPSCDALRNGVEWEFKTVKSLNPGLAVQKAIRQGKRQSANIMCLIKTEDIHLHDISLGIYRAVKRDTQMKIQQIAILFPNGQLIEIDRIEVVSGTMMKKFFG